MFRSKEELELTIVELEQWLDNKNSKIQKDLEPICKDLLNELKNYLVDLNQRLENLEKAEIKDKDKIQQKVVSIVLGNRRSFINQSSFFVSRIKPPNYENVNQIIDYSVHLKSEMDNFAKITHKSFYTSQHLFYKQVEEIKKTIQKISKLNNNFNKKIQENKVNYLKELDENLDWMKKSINDKLLLLKDLSRLKLKLEQVKENKMNFEEKTKQITISPTYKQYLEEEKYLNQIEEQIKKHKLKLEHNFAVIDFALKKYTHIADEEYKLIHGYRTDTFGALLKDEEFNILKALQKLTQKVLENKIVLKDSKKQKILTELNMINRSYLSELLSEYKKLDKERKKIKEKIDQNQIVSEINQAEEKIIKLGKEIQEIERNINNLNKNIDKIDYLEIKKIIEEKFDIVFGIKLMIKLVEDDPIL